MADGGVIVADRDGVAIPAAMAAEAAELSVGPEHSEGWTMGDGERGVALPVLCRTLARHEQDEART